MSCCRPHISIPLLRNSLAEPDARRPRAVRSSDRELVGPDVALVRGVALYPLQLRLGAHRIPFSLLHQHGLDEVPVLYWALVCPPTIRLPFDVPFLDTLDRVL